MTYGKLKVDQLEDSSGNIKNISDIGSGGSGGVTSVNGQTGAVTVTSDVTSVNSLTGAVSLDLDALSDVNASSPTDGQVLSWDNSASEWVASTASGGGGGTKIEQGDTKAEVTDTGSDGVFSVTTDGTERLRVTSNGDVSIVADDKKLLVGADDDIQLHRTSGVSYIDNTDSGDLRIRGASGGNVSLQSPSGENSVVALSNGGVQLYYDNNNRFQTTYAGATLTGALTATSFVKSGGTSSEFLMADGSVSTSSGGGGGVTSVNGQTGVVTVTSDVTSVNSLTGAVSLDLDALSDVNASSPTDGQVLSWDNSASEWVASTASGGGGGTKIEQGDTKAEVTDTGSDGVFSVTTDGTERLRVTSNGDVSIVADDKKLLVGADDDIQLHRTSGVSYIDNTDSGDLRIRGASGGNVSLQSPSGENSVVALSNGGVQLYYDNNNRFQTTYAGATLTGALTATSFVKSGGTSSEFLMADGSVSTGGGGGATELDGLSDAATWNSGQGIAIGINAGQTIIANNGLNKLVAIGLNAAQSAQTGQYNTIIGMAAGQNLTSSSNTMLGYYAGQTLTSGENNLILGANSTPSSTTVSHEITLGDSNITALRCAVTSITSLSDSRDKKDIESIDAGLDFINAVRPVKFEWDLRERVDILDDNDTKIGERQPREGVKEYGFIAQELDAVQTQFGTEDYSRLVSHNNPDKLEADTYRLFPILVKAVQELSAKVAELEANANA